MQDNTDARTEDFLARPRVLVKSVERWKRTQGQSGRSTDQRRQSHGSSSVTSLVDQRDDDVIPSSQEIPIDEEADGTGPFLLKMDGKLPVINTASDFDRPTTRSASRHSQLRQVPRTRRFAGGSNECIKVRTANRQMGPCVGSSHSIQEIGDESTNLHLGCGSSSSLTILNLGVEQGEEREDEGFEGKEMAMERCENTARRTDSCTLRRCEESRLNSGVEAEGSQRRTRLGKQVEVDESDGEGSRPETSLCLGTHPRHVSAESGSSRVGSTTRIPVASLDARLGLPFVFEGPLSTPSKGKRKTDVDRSECAAAVSSALENADSESDQGQIGARSTRRMGGIYASLRERRRPAEQDPAIPSLLESPRRVRAFTRNTPAISVVGLVGQQPTVFSSYLEQPNGAEVASMEEDSNQPQEWRFARGESPPTTNASDESPDRLHTSSFIDLISPGPDRHQSSGIIDLVSPERADLPSGITRNVSLREDNLYGRPGPRRPPRRQRLRLQGGLVTERPRPSGGRHLRTTNGAGSSQEIPSGGGLPICEPASSESSLTRADLSRGLFLRSQFSWDDDLRILEQSSSHNQLTDDVYRRRGTRYFPGVNLMYPREGGDAHHGRTGGILSDIFSEELLRHSDNFFNLGDSDDDGNVERSRQLAEDERMARELQAAFVSEAVGGDAPDDESLARLLQAEEDTRARDFRRARSGELFGLSAVQRYLGDVQNMHSGVAPRFSRHAIPRSDTQAYLSSSSRIQFPSRSNRYVQFARGQPVEDAELPGGRVPFPSHMPIESVGYEPLPRSEVLAALENAIQEQVSVGLQLAQVDRDFNENDYEMLLALDTDIDRNKGASLEKIALLPLTTLQPTDVCEDTCSICLEMQVSGEVVRRLPCIHVFHKLCIDKWLQRQAVCPVCKAHI